MSPSEIEQRILNLLTDRLDREVPGIDTDLLETGVLDSLLLVDLLMHLEEEFGVTIALDQLEIDVLRSVASLSLLVRGMLGESEGTSTTQEQAVSA